jgi:hypothetical protein
MIRNGDLPIQLPPLVRAGDEISARLFNQLIMAMKRLSDRTPVESNNGKGSKGSSAPFMPILKAEKGEGGFTYKIALSKGYVVERRIPDGQALIYHFPTGLVDDDDNPIYQAISDGQAIYIQVQVQEDGTIEEEPVVLVAEDELEGEHFRPEVFDFGGNAGTHNYKIAKLEMQNGKPKLKLFGAGDNVDHYDERVGMINIKVEEAPDADIYNVGKTYETGDDKIHFRTLQQLDDDGEPIIKAKEVGVPELDSIQFRRIKDKGSDAQVHVKDSGDAIMIEGNGYPSSVTNAHKISMTVEDGLVTDLQQIDAEGWWGTIGFSFLSSESYVTAALVFEDGMLKTVEVNATNIEGTEGTPGVANINFSV